jgi:mxaJ protein
MSSRSPSRVRSQRSRAGGLALGLLAVSAAALAALPGALGNGPLRVCADPDNAPFSSADRTGFENRLATMLASALGTEARFYWWPQRRGFVRNTLDAKVCDVVMGMPAGSAGVLTTPAYYEAGYVFAYRPDRVQAPRSYDDPALRSLRVGVPLVGNDMAATPPGHALARRHLTDNVIGYPPFGRTSVGERMMAALADGTLDVALLWAPQAAYYAQRQDFEVKLAPAQDDRADEPQRFAMAVAVRSDEPALRDAIAAALAKLAPRIDTLMREVGLPGARSLPASGPALLSRGP